VTDPKQIETVDQSRVDLIDISDTGAAIGAARHMAADVGFGETEQYLIATAVSELATNVIRYAGRGELTVKFIRRDGRNGFEVVALDAGPGIEDIEKAMQEHFSTGNSLGLGLPGVKRIMDEFHIESRPGRGTRCVARKWRDTDA
jgi:Anti-sigma regulatory factor (Ser/Thr protein kinase)